MAGLEFDTDGLGLCQAQHRALRVEGTVELGTVELIEETEAVEK